MTENPTPKRDHSGVIAFFALCVVFMMLVFAVIWGAHGIASLLREAEDAVYCYDFPETTEYIDKDYVFYRVDDVLVKEIYTHFSVDCPAWVIEVDSKD